MYPDGIYRYGEVGIGTCLAGPADLRFFQQDGGTFLAVTNADPYREFRSGSVLFVDWDDLAARLDAGPPERIPMDEVVAFPLEIVDDDDGDGAGDNPYLGHFGYLAESQTAVVTSRFSEDAALRAGKDELFVLDLSRLELAQGPELLGRIQLEDDPYPVVVDEPNGRVYAGNLTDHSVSVLTTGVTGDAALPLAEVDVAPGASATESPFVDADASGSVAEVSDLSVDDRDAILEDRWTLTYVDATERLWIPTPVSEDSDLVGVVRYTSGDATTWIPSAFGIEDLAGAVEDPFVEIDPDGVVSIWFARDGDVWRALGAVEAGEWGLFEDPVLDAAIGLHGAPSAAPLAGEVGLFTDYRDDAGDDARIVLSVSPDGSAFGDTVDVLVPPAGTSYEHPFAVFDLAANRYRMWLTVRTGTQSSIAISESDDGRTGWTVPEPVLYVPGRPAAAPTVGVLDGRYGMWLDLVDEDGVRWDHAFAWGYDGRRWTDPVVVVEGQVPFDPVRAPRAAALVDRVGAWRVAGVDQGTLPELLPAGLPEPTLLFGFSLALASGHEIENGVVAKRRADQALLPGSVVRTDGRTLLFASSTGSASRDRIVVLEEIPTTPSEGGFAEDWVLAVDPADMDDMLGIGAAETASRPVVVQDGGGFVMFFTLADTTGARIHRATSPDGFTWTAEPRALLAAGVAWDAAGQQPHSVELLDGGAVRLWYTGNDGSRSRIGSARADALGGSFERETGTTSDWRMGTGLPGGFDDSGVADPLAVTIGAETHLYYAGFDGLAWHLGHAVVGPDGEIERRIDPATDLPLAVMSGLERTFSAAGVAVPVLWDQTVGRLDLLYAGTDGQAWRVGRAGADTGAPDMVFAEQAFPTAGDTFAFTTTRGGRGAQVVELGQVTQWYATTGHGMSSITHDPDRGFLYVTSKVDSIGGDSDSVYVIDVRDDTDGSFVDENVLDLETLVRVDTDSALAGFRDAALARTRGLLYLTMRNPDGLVILDLTRVLDDDDKAPLDQAAVAVLPLADLSEDAGEATLATIGGSGMALTADEDLLLVAHFRGNALSVWDVSEGAWGQEIAWIPDIGENPHVVRISPDGRYAVVGNYVGDVTLNTVSSTLAVVDLDPASDRYLEIVTWLANFP